MLGHLDGFFHDPEDRRQRVGLTPRDARRAMDTLGVRFGYCLSPTDTARLMANPPETVEQLVEAVIVAEGRDPIGMDKAEIRSMQAAACATIESDPRRNP